MRRSSRRWLVTMNARVRQVTRNIMKEWDVHIGTYTRQGWQLPGEHSADWGRVINQIETARAYLDSMERVAIRERDRLRVIEAGGDDPGQTC